MSRSERRRHASIVRPRRGHAILPGWAARALLATGALLMALTGRPWAPPALDLASEYALAQGVPTVQATMPAVIDTATPTSSATATGVPVPTATAVTTAPTSAAGTPTSTMTAASTPTSTVQTTPTPTTTPQPTPTPLPTSVLPPLAPTPDLPGVAATATIDSAGGRVNSPDGRVTVDVPAGVFPTAVNVTVTRKDHHLLGAPWPDSPLAGAWQFDAVVAASGAPLRTFAGNVTVSVRFGGGDLLGRNPATLAFWTWDELNRQWVSVPAALDPTQQMLTASLSHFSTDAASADNLVDAAPLLDGHNVGVQGGTADLSIPIEVPPGPGGLTPDLALSYDSGRLWEMRTYSTAAGWAGMGWELSTGSIQVSTSSDGGHVRAFLDLNGLSGELMPVDVGGSLWHLRDEQYARVSTNCGPGFFYEASPCTWWVTDKQGRTYTFGANSADPSVDTHHALRWVWQCPPPLSGGSCSWVQTFYRFDLASVTDRLGHSINYTYAQQIGSSQPVAPSQPACINCSYVIASYPTSVTYGGVTISFQLGCDPLPSGTCGRQDAPQNQPAQGGCGSYPAPPVEETQRLMAVTVSNGGQQLRRYELGHTSTPFNRAPNIFQSSASCNPYVGYINTTTPALCPSAGTGCTYVGGTDILNSLTIKGADNSSVLSVMAFQYADLQTTHWSSGGTWYYNYPHITRADNGFGGSVLFDYAQISDREAVHHETHRSGLGEPDVVTTYDDTGEGEQYYPDPYVQPSSSGPTNGYDIFNAAFHGFAQVTETDGAGVQTIHSYYTTGTYCCGGTSGSASWQNEILTGREYQTVVKGSDARVWKTVATTFQTVAIPNSFYPYATEGNAGQSFINFVAPLQVATTLKDGTTSYVQNIYDTTSGTPPATPAGLLVEQDEFLGAVPIPGQATACPGGSCMLQTKTSYAYDTTDWIFVPQYEAKLDASYGTLAGCTRYYYDGAAGPNSAGTLVAGSAKGLLTAKSTAISISTGGCDAGATTFATSTNTYSVYDADGNVVQASVPTSVTPETQSCASTSGCIPSGVASTTTAFDSTYHVYPTSVTNPLGQTTTTTYAFPYGKPGTITEPTGHVTQFQYDTFGRLTQVSDNYDPNHPGTPLASPTTLVRTITYNWGAAPNRTVVQQYAGGPSPQTPPTLNMPTTVTCMDGFGRTVEQRQSYLDTAFGTLLSSVRTDYDVVGRKAVQTNPVASNSSLACDSSPAPTAARDRTAFAYDPLGNVMTTTFLAANQTSGPSTQTLVNGLTTTTIDENGHKTYQYSWPTWRLRFVTQYTGTGTTGDPYAAYATTVYTDDALGRLVTVQDPLSNQTTITYDLAGRKRTMHDPDMGNWTYGYAAAGNLTSQTDNRGITTTLQYDALNRLTQKTYSNGDPSVSFTYDNYLMTINQPHCGISNTAIGHEVESYVGTSPSVVTASQSCFDVRGQAMATWTAIGSGVGSNQYSMNYGHDLLGNVHTVAYPGGETVTADYSPDTANLVDLKSSLGDAFVSQAYTTPWGAPGGLALGNGLTTRYGYDSRQRLTDIQSGTSTTGPVAQHLALTYDDASNVTSVTDKTSGELASYQYDALNRLTGMQLNGVAAAASYLYDIAGNMTSKQEGLNGANPSTLCYPAAHSAQPHAVTSVLSAGACGTGTLSVALAYDANGNLCATAPTALSNGCTTNGANLYTFDAENRLKTRPVAGGGETYTYDAHGTLVKRTNTADGTSTDYVGGTYEVNHDVNNVVTGTTKYYQAFGRVIAMRTSNGACSPGPCYLLADHLGSTVGVTDNSGNVLATQKYWPYGAVRSGTVSQTDKLYTGQRQEPGDPSLGLYNYRARFYSTVVGRFVSADPVTADGLNRYKYVLNNPLRFSDPSGLCAGQWANHCTQQNQLDIFDCAFKSKCSDEAPLEDMIRLSRWFLQQDEFWNNFARLVRAGDVGLPVYALLEIPNRDGVTLRRLGYISNYGWDALGTYFGVPGQFLKYSLYDLSHGSQLIGQDERRIVGAMPWWDNIPNDPAGAQLGLIGDAYGFDSDTLDAYEIQLEGWTVGWAWTFSRKGLPVDRYDWSNYQRRILRLNYFEVDDSRFSSWEHYYTGPDWPDQYDYWPFKPFGP